MNKNFKPSKINKKKVAEVKFKEQRNLKNFDIIMQQLDLSQKGYMSFAFERRLNYF